MGVVRACGGCKGNVGVVRAMWGVVRAMWGL